jgi:hypothetical protein
MRAISRRCERGRTWAGIIPLQERIETVGDDADLHPCSRSLLVTSGNTPSEFLDDLRA